MLSDLRVEVINRGVPGYSSVQGVHLLREHLQGQRFDLAIISYGWNDANESPVTDLQRLSLSGEDSLHTALRQSRLYLTLAGILLRWKDQRSVDGSRQTLRARVTADEYVEALVEMAELVRNDGGQVILVSKPYDEDVTASARDPIEDSALEDIRERKLARMRSYNLAVFKAAARCGCPYVDLAKKFESYDSSEVFDSPVHPSAEGHRRIAELLEPAVRAILDEKVR
jgi:lysophospholipase L1-like esterase